MRSVPIGLPLVAAAFLAGCATTPGGQRLAERDPLESWNRNVWAFNRGVDNALLKPGAQTYKAVTPTAARRGVRNVLNNADEPLSFINARSEEHTSELQSLMRISYAVFCLKKKNKRKQSAIN